MSTAVDQPVLPEEALAWEADHRRSSGIFAVSAALLTLIGSIVFSLVTADTPRVLAVTAFQDAVGERPAGSVGLKTAPLLFTNDHAVQLILVAIVLAAGSCLMAPALAYVYRAAAARTPRLPRLALFAALIGPIAVGVATLVLQIVVVVKAGDFASSADHSTAAAHDAVSGPFVVGTTLLRALGVLIVALAYILISLNAMRVGLLSRFMGIIGILAGVQVAGSVD